MDKVNLLKAIEVEYWDELALHQRKSRDGIAPTLKALLNVRALLAQMDTKGLEDK